MIDWIKWIMMIFEAVRRKVDGFYFLIIRQIR